MNTRSITIASRMYAGGVVTMAIVNLVIGDFDPTQPVPASVPFRTMLAYATSVFLLLAGSAIMWPRTRARAAAALTAYFALVVTLMMNGSAIPANYRVYGAYFGAIEGLALAAAGLIIFAASGKIEHAPARGLMRLGQLTFGMCALFFGGAHFAYPDNTISLVPRWLPPSQVFWAYATGVFQIAAGVAILTKIRGRLAAILLAIMYASFTPLVHMPLLLSDPSRHFFWTENALNLALIGVAWVIGESYQPPASVVAAGLAP